nr:PorP/SprF family type IX secretion system membrane protein [uncultured Marinifilum sp.]
MKGKISLLFLIVISLHLRAQKIPLMSYDQSPLQYNPSSIVEMPYAKVSFYNRVQRINSEPSFTTSLITGVLPVLNDKPRNHKGAIGVSFMSEDLSSNHLLKEENFTVAMAYQLQVADELNLGFGISWNVLQRFFNNNGFTTGSQYVIGEGFSPSLAINEDFQDVSDGYSTWNSGLRLEKTVYDGRVRAYIGFTVSNLNRPVYTSGYDNDDRLSYQYGLQGGYNFLLGRELSVLADGDFRFYDDNQWVNLGLKMMYNWKNSEGGFFKEGCIELIPRYVLDKAYAFALEFSQSFYSIRVGRTITTSKISSSYMASNEIVLSLRKNFGKKKKPRLSDRIKKAGGLVRKKKEEYVWDDEYWDYTTVDQHKIIDKSLKKFINSLIERLHKHENSIIHIRVYTDMMANDAKNLEVSVHRAEIISDYFEEHGIEENRIDYFGEGNSKPIVANAYGQARLKNRRIKFIIYR